LLFNIMGWKPCRFALCSVSVGFPLANESKPTKPSSAGKLETCTSAKVSAVSLAPAVTGERIRDKIAASKRKGMWMVGRVPVGYDVKERKLIANHTRDFFTNIPFEPETLS